MKNIIKIIFSVYHWKMNLLAAFLYKFPSRKITVIGVTGTKGKTTTVGLISYILEKSGKKTAYISTTKIKIGEATVKNTTGNTMPGRFFIQKFLFDSVNAGCDVALIEVSSQGIVQHRHKFIFWDRLVFLNIHPEHIEAHGSFENYLNAKLNFFRYAASHYDSKKPEFFIYSQDERALNFETAAGPWPITRFSPLTIESMKIKIPQPLTGNYNKINIAAAVVVARSLKIEDKTIIKGIEDFSGVEGRMDVVISKPFTAIVDYAHTPDSLEAVYGHLRNGLKKGNLICVLGSAGGGRDKWKRPVFGSLAAKYCDNVILTNEDPYDENPGGIIDEIEKGYLNAGGKGTKIEKIIDRTEAIKKAISMAKAGDVVICTGKGSEDSIHLARGQKIPWSEKEAIIGAVRKNNSE
jgi:UDP-N-acetylmuramyl-tripeptide synthetase